jgi:hypothetical protein
MITEAFSINSVATTAPNTQPGAPYLDLQVIRANPRQIYLYNPTLRGTVNVRRRIPEPTRRSRPPRSRDQLELTIGISHSKRISENADGEKGS